MGKTSGCVLILAGLSVGAYALYEPQPQAEIAAAVRAPGGGADGTSPVLKVADKPDKKHGGSDASPAPQPATKPAPEPLKGDKSGKGGPPGVAPPTHLVPPVPVPAKRPRTAVAAVQVDAAPPRVPVGESKADPRPLSGTELTSEIQRHLKRIGCYRGEVTGVWSPSVRQAMRALTDRANATLPVDGPDPVLLAMVQGQEPGACGTDCPRGQDRAADGRCVPSALVASAKAKRSVKTTKAEGDAVKKRPGPGVVASVPSDPSAPPTAHGPADERMSLAGPPVAAAAQAKAQRRSSKVAGWSRSVQGRPRVRRAQRPPYTGYSSVPSWALPFLMP
jgi:hypothetical protein